MGLKGFGGVDLASFAEPTANVASTPIETQTQQASIPDPAPIANPANPVPVPEEEEEYADDDFADFDFESPAAPVPPPPVVVAPPVVVPEPIKPINSIAEVQTATVMMENQKSRTSSSIQAPTSEGRISNSNSLQAAAKSLSSSVVVEPAAPAPPIIQSLPEPPLIKVDEVVAVDYDNYDPFDDFEFDAKKPKKTMIMDPKQMREFQAMDLGRKSEASHSSGQDKSNSDANSSSRTASGMNKMKSALAGMVSQVSNRASEPPRGAEEDENEADELLQYSRERSTNTVAAGPVYSRPAINSNFKLDAAVDDFSNLRILDNLVSKTKTNKMQEEALRLEYENKDLKELIAQDLSDISLSDQELEEPSAQTSPTREASKTKGALATNPESAAFRSKEAKLRSKLEELRSKANDKSKMHSIFLSRPQEEFERMAFTYHDEIGKVKESAGKLKVDLDSMNNHTVRAALAEVSVDNVRPNFHEFFAGRYGLPRCLVPDKSANNFLVGTEKGLIVVFDQKMIENYATLQLASAADDFPVCMFPDWDNDLVWVGMNKGDVWAIKHNPVDNSVKKIAHSKDFSPNAEILDLVVSKNKEHIVAVDGEYRILYSKLDKSKPIDKTRITATQIAFTKRDVLPHLEIKEVAPDIYLCVITAGVQVTIFEFKPEVKNHKGPTYTKMLEMELDQSDNLDSSLLLPLFPVGYDPRKSEISSSSTDPNLVTLADEKGEGDTVRKGRRVSETNESYPLLVKFNYDPNRSLALAVSFKKTLYIFDLLPTAERTFKAQPITEIQIRARAVNIGFFSTGKIILMDIYNDFYLIDVPLGVKFSEAHGSIAKQTSSTAADLAALNSGQAPSSVPAQKPRPTPGRSTSVRKSFLTNSIDKTREFLSSMNGNKTPSNVNGTLFVDPTQEFDQTCVFLIYPYGNVDQIVSNQTRTRNLTCYSSLITKSQTGEFFFVNQKGLIRLSIMNWKQLLDTCLSQENYLKALKTVNELLDGEFETLRRPPPKRQLPAELAPYIRKIIEEFVEELKMAPPEDIEIFMNYCMMTLIKNGMQEYITEDLEIIMDEHDLIGYFWKSLVLLFRSQLIPSLEFEKIMRIVSYLEKDPLEKQRFILYLFNRKLYRDMLFNNLANRGNINLLFFLSDKVDDPHKSTFALQYVKDSIEIHSGDPEKRAQCYFQMFWYVSEFVEKKLEKREVKYGDHSWYILNWFFNPELVAFLLEKDLKAYLEGWFLLFEKKFPQLMAFNNGLDLLEGYQYPINEIVNLKKTCSEMASLMSSIFSFVKQKPQDLNYFYFWIAIVKFHKVPCIELNDNALKELVLTLIKNINEIVSDPRLGINHEDLNILIFATFTEHKEIFVDNSELRDLIMKNEKSLRLLYHEMNRDISATFSLYRKLSRDNEQFKFRMFQWLKKGIEIKGEKEEMMNLIKNEFGFLLTEDVSCLCDLMAAMKLEDQMKTVLIESVDSQNLLLIFDSIMDYVKTNSLENDLTDPFKIRYLSLLLQFDRKRVMYQLKYSKYPLSECLTLCEKRFKHELATAYLKDRLGHTVESLDIYKNRLKKHVNFLISKKMQLLGAKADKLRAKVMDKLNDEMELAINLCKEGSADMLSDYLDFMVSFTDKKKYFNQKDPLRNLLISKSKLVFDTILDMTTFEKLLQTLRSDKKNITNNQFLMERLMNHYRETMRLSNVCVDINITDWYDINGSLLNKKSPAVKTKMPKHDPELTHLMLYRRCKHMHPAPSSLKEGKVIYCALCAAHNENAKALNNLDKFKLNVERLPLSSQLDFSSAGRSTSTGKLQTFLQTSSAKSKELKSKCRIFDQAFANSKRSILHNELFEF